MRTDVTVVGAGPTGLMLAAELRLAGAQVLVLERRPQPWTMPRASGLGGRVLRLLEFRGLIDPDGDRPAPVFPFGGLHVDFTHLADPPMEAMAIPQAELEKLLDARARELGAEIRRGHEVTGLRQDDDGVTVDVAGPDGPYEVTAGYLAGCDGPRSPIREAAGIPFPGTTYPEVNRFGQVKLQGKLPGKLPDRPAGLSPGFHRTENGVFAFGLTGTTMSAMTTEDETTEYDDDSPMTLAEFGASIHRVLGVEIPLGEPLRLSRFTFKARHADRYRDGRIFLAGDAAHLFPATGVALNAGLMDAANLAWKLGAAVAGWAPDGLLDTYHDERHLAATRTLLHTRAQVALRRGTDPAADALRSLMQELLGDEQPLRRVGALLAGADVGRPAPAHIVGELLRDARPVFVDMAGREDLRAVARRWQPRISIRVAEHESRPADALLIRPDGEIAWAAGDDCGLSEALTRWFGTA